MKKSLFENFSLNFVKTLMGIVFPMITFPYASRVLGSNGIGAINFSESIVSYFMIFAGLGISTYGIREAAKLRDDKEALSGLAGELFTINLITSMIAYIVLLISLTTVGFLRPYKILILIQSMTIIFTMLGMDWIFTALEEYRYITIRAVVFQFISLILLFVLVRHEGDTAKYAFVCTFAGVGSATLNFFYCRKFVKIKVKVSKNLKKHMKPIFYIFGTSLASSIYMDLDRTMLGIISGDNAVGLYTAATKVTKILSTLLSCITNVVLPRVSYYVKKKDKKEFNNIIIDTANYTFMLSVPLAFGVIVLNSEIIQILCGSGFGGSEIPLIVLSINLIVSGINRILAWVILVPTGNENKVMCSTIIGAVSNLILNIIFINKFGIIGAAIATLISESFVMIVCIKFCKDIVSIKKVYCNLHQYIIAACLFIPLNFIIKRFISSAFAILIVQVIISVAAYALILKLIKNEYIEKVVCIGKGFIKR